MESSVEPIIMLDTSNDTVKYEPICNKRSVESGVLNIDMFKMDCKNNNQTSQEIDRHSISICLVNQIEGKKDASHLNFCACQNMMSDVIKTHEH